MLHKPYKLSSPVQLLKFFTELEAENARRQEKGLEAFTPLLEQQSIIVDEHCLLGMHNAIRQNLHLKPQLRYMDMIHINDLVLASAVGKENAFVTEGILVIGKKFKSGSYAQLKDLEISAAATEALSDRVYMRIAEGFSNVTVEGLKDFVKEEDLFTYEEVTAMGLTLMGRPSLENPVDVAKREQGE